MIPFAHISLGEGAAAPCARCAPPVAAEYRPAVDVDAEVGAAMRSAGAGEANVSFGGAEPLGHPELPEIVFAAAQAGAQRIRLETNAEGLAVGGNAAGALAAGVRYLLVDVAAGDQATHDRLTARPGAWAATIAGVDAFTQAAREESAATAVAVRLTLCSHNQGEGPAVAALAARLGATRLVVDAADSDVDIVAARDWIVAACETATVNGVWTEVRGVPYCLMPGMALHVASALQAVEEGRKAAACGECALEGWCAGLSPRAGADVLESLSPPPDAARTAAGVQRVRGVKPA